MSDDDSNIAEAETIISDREGGESEEKMDFGLEEEEGDMIDMKNYFHRKGKNGVKWSKRPLMNSYSRTPFY